MRILTLLLVALCLVIAGCGGDDEEPTTGSGATTPATETTPATTTEEEPETAGGGGVLEVAADPSGEIAFTETELTAPAGEVEISFTNDAQLPHDVVVEKDGDSVGKTDVIAGDKASTTVTLEPGEYTFYCSVGNHRQEGMEGTITVK